MSQGRVKRIVIIKNFGRGDTGQKAISIVDWPGGLVFLSIPAKFYEIRKLNKAILTESIGIYNHSKDPFNQPLFQDL